MLFFNVNRAEYTSFLINLLIVSTKKIQYPGVSDY